MKFSCKLRTQTLAVIFKNRIQFRTRTWLKRNNDEEMSILPLLSYVRRRRDVRIEGEKVQWPAAPMPQIEVNVSEETRVTHVPCSQQIYNARYMHAYRHSARPNDDKSCIG